MINIILLIIAFITDIIIGLFIGNNIVGIGISGTPNTLLIALVLITLKMDFKNTVLLSFFAGFSLDLFNIDSIYMFAIVYVLTTIIVSLWATRVNDTFIEMFLVTISAIFFKEIIVYLINVSFFNYVLSIGNWAVDHLTLTIIMNIIPTVIAINIKIKKFELEDRNKRTSKKSDFLNFRYYE